MGRDWSGEGKAGTGREGERKGEAALPVPTLTAQHTTTSLSSVLLPQMRLTNQYSYSQPLPDVIIITGDGSLLHKDTV